MTKKTYTPEELLGAEKVCGYFKIKGKYYASSAKDGKMVYVEVNKKDVEDQLKLAKKLAKELKGGLDAEKVLFEVFTTKYDKKNLDKLNKLVFKSKRKYKPKTREGHCVDMKVGGHIIPLID